MSRLITGAMILLTAAMAGPNEVRATEWHVNAESGSDSNPGTADAPFGAIQKAITSASDGDSIQLHPKNAVYRQSATFRGRSGITIEGNGVTLDGADALPATGWESLSETLFRRKLPRTTYDRHLLIVDGVMERMRRTQSSNSPDFPAVSELKAGQFCFENIDDKTGWLYVCGSVEKLEWSTRVNGIATGGTCRQLVVRNLNTRNFLNDGFNIHGDARELKFESITGYDCFDEGFSAHDTCECQISRGRFWGNENGVADVNSAETSYQNSDFFNNVNTDVLLIGKAHSLLNCRVGNWTSAAALVAGPREKNQTFELRLDRVFIDTKRKSEPARVRINGGKLTITSCVFRNVAFVPLGADLTATDFELNGEEFRKTE